MYIVQEEFKKEKRVELPPKMVPKNNDVDEDENEEKENVGRGRRKRARRGKEEVIEDTEETDPIAVLGSDKRAHAYRTNLEAKKEREHELLEEHKQVEKRQKEDMELKRVNSHTMQELNATLASLVNRAAPQPAERRRFISAFKNAQEWFAHLESAGLRITEKDQCSLVDALGEYGYKFLKYFDVQKLVSCGLQSFVAEGYVKEAQNFD